MNVTVKDLMAEQVVVARPHDTVDHVRGMMERNRIHAMPIVDPDSAPLGVVSTADLARDLKPGAKVTSAMTEKVYTVPQYEGVHVAARVMRNHRLHHLIVTNEQKVVGVLSSFDLLRLVEDHRFVMKPGPTSPARRNGKRR